MKKVILPPLIVYVTVCLLAMILPASETYNDIGWKLFVGQAFAIPAFIIVAFATFYRYKKERKNEETK